MYIYRYRHRAQILVVRGIQVDRILPSVIDLKDQLQQETDIQQPQQVDTRPRPKWFRSTVQDSRQVDPPQTSFRQNVPPERLSYMALMTELINSEPSASGRLHNMMCGRKLWLRSVRS